MTQIEEEIRDFGLAKSNKGMFAIYIDLKMGVRKAVYVTRFLAGLKNVIIWGFGGQAPHGASGFGGFAPLSTGHSGTVDRRRREKSTY